MTLNLHIELPLSAKRQNDMSYCRLMSLLCHKQRGTLWEMFVSSARYLSNDMGRKSVNEPQMKYFEDFHGPSQCGN